MFALLLIFSSAEVDSIFNKVIDYIHDDPILTEFAHDVDFVIYLRKHIAKLPSEFKEFLPESEANGLRIKISKKTIKRSELSY